MKFKKNLMLVLAFIIFIPLASKASNMVDIKKIRGEKNYFADLVLYNNEMAYDETLLYKNMKNNSQKNKKTSSDDDRWEGDILKELSGKSFSFYSGAGAWMTNLNFTDDKGSFEADFHDSDANQVQLASCKGKFEVVERIDDTAFKLKLKDVKTTSKVGEFYVNGKLTIGLKVPYGFDISGNPDEYNTSYTLYLPKRLKSQTNDTVYAQAYAITDKAYINDYESRIFILGNDSTLAGFAENIN